MNAQSPYVLITGGAGFVGTNLAAAFARRGEAVMVFDNLSRPGVESNLAWLRDQFPELVAFRQADVRDREAVRRAVGGARAVFHLAAQVAVTTSLTDPTYDFEVNAYGTLNVLEAIRARSTPPPLIFTSTNKVLGGLDDLILNEDETRYVPADARIRECGIDESRGLSFCSPYGCSKGAADQYVLDYARTFQLPAVVFRMSCIYGPHQCGNEDQGWVAHFVRAALRQTPVTIYGDGKQVRDALFVEDLVEAFDLALNQIELLSGRAFNLGGGTGNTTSLLELIDRLNVIAGRPLVVYRDQWRPADQRFYVSDLGRWRAASGWSPRVNLDEGLARLYAWMRDRSGVRSTTWDATAVARA